MAGDSAKCLVRSKRGFGSYNTCPTLALQDEQPKWSWTLKLAMYGATLGAAVPVGYCTGVVNSPAVVSSCSIGQTVIIIITIRIISSVLLFS